MAPTADIHAPFRNLVQRIRDETKKRVPDVASDGPGTDARVLVILSDPGKLGALKTNELSPLRNNDQTARNQRKLFAEAGLDPKICVFWNAVPWDLDGRKAGSADKARGAAYLRDMLQMFDRPPVIVACGKDADEACGSIGATNAITVCHPSMQGLNRYPTNRPKHVRGLRLAAELSSGGTK